MEEETTGMIVVIEGTDCSGKATQSKLLEERLNKEGKKCVRISFPRYETPTGRIVGGPYLGKTDICPTYFESPVKLDPKISCLYYAADRLYSAKEIRQYVEEGYVVLLDRYTTSNLAHQGCKIEDKDERFYMYQWIDKLEYWLLDLPKPDRTIFLHVPYEFSAQLEKNRSVTDEHEKSPEHLKHAELAYIELSELYNWDKIECIKHNKLRTIEDIHEEIYKLVTEYKK